MASHPRGGRQPDQDSGRAAGASGTLLAAVGVRGVLFADSIFLLVIFADGPLKRGRSGGLHGVVFQSWLYRIDGFTDSLAARIPHPTP